MRSSHFGQEMHRLGFVAFAMFFLMCTDPVFAANTIDRLCVAKGFENLCLNEVHNSREMARDLMMAGTTASLKCQRSADYMASAIIQQELDYLLNNNRPRNVTWERWRRSILNCAAATAQ